MPKRALIVAGLVFILFPTTALAVELSPHALTPAVVRVPEETPLERPAHRLAQIATRLVASVSTRTTARPADEFIWPVEGAINTPFGAGHDGIDIEGETGDPIVAGRSGRIIFAGDDGDGYGTKILIDHGKGISTLYSHLAEITVPRGWVNRGEKIGTVGCTGSCTGDHLHFEIQENESPLNPLDFLPGASA
ncbi:MAG TPA: M23 family metallopeptidase [Actinomycetota bacterium]|nr:M23 family metallopeptidase [Actinomycetota bacterium]